MKMTQILIKCLWYGMIFIEIALFSYLVILLAALAWLLFIFLMNEIDIPTMAKILLLKLQYSDINDLGSSYLLNIGLVKNFNRGTRLCLDVQNHLIWYKDFQVPINIEIENGMSWMTPDEVKIKLQKLRCVLISFCFFCTKEHHQLPS